MIAQLHINSDYIDPFFKAEEKFTELTKRLKSRETRGMEFSGLEGLLEKEGRELLRSLLQAHLDSRGTGSVGDSIEGSDFIRRAHKRIGSCHIKSIFGKVELDRVGYSTRGEESLFPQDSHLNLPKTSPSHGLQRIVASEVIHTSYDRVVEAVCERTGVPMPKEQVEYITVRAAADFDTFYAQKSTEERIEAAKASPILALSVDGKGIHMRKEDLKPATRKKAAEQKNKLETRLSRGEKTGSKRMATVASVYSIDPFVRSATDFEKELTKDFEEDTRIRPRPQAKRVWASVDKSSEEVTKDLFAEALRRDPKHEKQWVALVDGDPRQIDRIEAEAKERGITITLICDIIHVIEYLWKAAWAFFTEGDPKAEAWVTERFIAVLEGKSSTVSAGIRRSATNQKLVKKQREAVDTCCDYLLNKGPYLKYDEYMQKGFPIATGVIEGACRHLIKDRMDITGARWRLKGAEAVIQLRSLRASGDFKEYWEFHEKQEFTRNHGSKYKNRDILDKLNIRRAKSS